MADLSRHFSRSEMQCPCCGVDTIDFQTLIILEELRDNFGAPITITSAYRCKAHNAAVDGEENSQHLHGRAVDFKVAGVEAADVQAYLHLRYPGIYGIGSYLGFTHFDSRGGDGARWHG